MTRKRKTINEMGVGVGGVAGGMGKLGDPARKMSKGAFGEDDLDMGPPGMEDDLGDELGDEGLEDEEGDSVECSKAELQELLSAVEMGEKSAEEAFDQLCVGDCDEGLGDELDGLGDEGGLGDELGDELGGLGGPVGGGPMESITRIAKIANLLTEDPDIFRS